MSTTIERVSVLEVKVTHVDQKIDELKVDVKEMHDCLDRTRNTVMDELKIMSSISTEAHAELAKKISSLEKDKSKVIFMFAGGVAVFGWLTGHFDLLLKILT